MYGTSDRYKRYTVYGILYRSIYILFVIQSRHTKNSSIILNYSRTNVPQVARVIELYALRVYVCTVEEIERVVDGILVRKYLVN